MYKYLAVAALATGLTACGTITRGTNDVWEVETDPPGAAVTTSNGYQCESTPCAIKMPRKSEFVATIEHEGYRTHRVNVTNRVSGAGGTAMAGNVLVGGIIGAGVDAGTGAMLDLTPNPLILEMVALEPGESADDADPIEPDAEDMQELEDAAEDAEQSEPVAD